MYFDGTVSAVGGETSGVEDEHLFIQREDVEAMVRAEFCVLVEGR